MSTDRRIWPALVGSLIFVLVTCAATAGLALTIANSQVGVDTEYHARFTNVSGLVVGDDIRIAGVRVGKVDAIVLDVGGFLGVGEKKVAVGMDNLSFMTDKDGNKYLYTTFTKEQLDAQPAYDDSTYAEKRDEQRLMMQ